jgi:phenylacetic acid degradation operon negative regulatory protein
MPPQFPIAVGALVEAAEILGIGENSLRVALTRLRASGHVESDERGLYRLGPAAEALHQQVLSWRTAEDRNDRWDGSWVAVEPGEIRGVSRGAATRRARTLRLLGFRPFRGTLALRPNNLVGGVEAVRTQLGSLGVGPESTVFLISNLDAENEQRARNLWDTEQLDAGYLEMRKKLEQSTTRLPTLSREAAMEEAFRLGGEAIRQIVFDPLLPSPIISTKPRRALVETMKRYDRLGRRFWKAWAGESVTLEQSPGDVRGLTESGRSIASTPLS